MRYFELLGQPEGGWIDRRGGEQQKGLGRMPKFANPLNILQASHTLKGMLELCAVSSTDARPQTMYLILGKCHYIRVQKFVKLVQTMTYS